MLCYSNGHGNFFGKPRVKTLLPQRHSRSQQRFAEASLGSRHIRQLDTPTFATSLYIHMGTTLDAWAEYRTLNAPIGDVQPRWRTILWDAKGLSSGFQVWRPLTLTRLSRHLHGQLSALGHLTFRPISSDWGAVRCPPCCRIHDALRLPGRDRFLNEQVARFPCKPAECFECLVETAIALR